MTPAEASFLGALQGATEFLPVSSSGHLRLGQALLDAQPPTLFFDVALHVGTLLAVVIVFRRDLLSLASGLRYPREVPAREREGVRRLALLMVSMLPTGVIGLALKDTVEEITSPAVVGGLLILNGCVLLGSWRYAQRVPTEDRDAPWEFSWRAAVLIGTAQGLAVFPGISRSGATIVTALALGIRPRVAAVYSFVLSIPAILAATMLTLRDIDTLTHPDLVAALIGALVAAVVGALCLILLLALIRRAKFHHFAWYCFGIGSTAILWTIL